MSLLQRPILISTATAAIAFASLVLLEWTRPLAGRRELSEAAFIETFSAALWFVAAAVAVVAASRRRDLRADLLLVAWIWVIFGARELDFHTRFTAWNMAHAIKLTKDYIPLWLRIAVFAFVWLPLVTAGILIATRWRRRFVAALRERRPWPLGVLWWIILLMASRVADKLSGFWKDRRGASDAWMFRGAEESLELGVVVLTVVMLGGLAVGEGRGPRAEGRE